MVFEKQYQPNEEALHMQRAGWKCALMLAPDIASWPFVNKNNTYNACVHFTLCRSLGLLCSNAK